jgi:hypothetical protein
MPSKPQRPAIELQDRDFAVLRGLFESRVMTLAHIAALYFEGKAEATKKRLQKLKMAGYVRERPRRPYEPSVLFLTRSAFVLLSEHGDLAEYPRIGLANLEKRAQVSDLTLRHELAVMDVKAALVMALRRLPQFRLVEFSTWPALCQFETRVPARHGFRPTDVVIKPDGLIRIHEEDQDGISEHVFYLELDRSTETQETLALRSACYGSYYRSGGFAVRCGADRSKFQEYPFRVLMVFKNAERRNNAAERMLCNNPPIHTQVWLTTLAEMRSDPLGPIWVRPIDYRDILRGTVFEISRQGQENIYRRRPEREAMVEVAILKHPLLEDDSGHNDVAKAPWRDSAGLNC